MAKGIRKADYYYNGRVSYEDTKIGQKVKELIERTKAKDPILSAKEAMRGTCYSDECKLHLIKTLLTEYSSKMGFPFNPDDVKDLSIPEELEKLLKAKRSKKRK